MKQRQKCPSRKLENWKIRKLENQKIRKLSHNNHLDFTNPSYTCDYIITYFIYKSINTLRFYSQLVIDKLRTSLEITEHLR